MAGKTNFRGSYTALVTPFKNGALDEAGFRAFVNWQIAEGTHGLVPVGTTGESPTVKTPYPSLSVAPAHVQHAPVRLTRERKRA